jgi:hypothetical protein
LLPSFHFLRFGISRRLILRRVEETSEAVSENQTNPPTDTYSTPLEFNMVSPSLCGGFLSDKHSMMAFTWTISTLLTLMAFLVAIVLVIQIHTHYRRMERYYSSSSWYTDYYANYGQDQEEEQGGMGGHQQEYNMDEADRIAESAMLLASLSSRSISFVAVYTMAIAVALNLYGSTAIVGFTSLQGVYIAPCFSSSGSMSHNNMHVGMFGGAIVIFANLLVVGAVILGEVRVSGLCENLSVCDTLCFLLRVLSADCMYFVKTIPDMRLCQL